ncbi:hypothetical protein [Acetivibrio cellulolyticus]|uniref:hypothetical protein n=1 Tax=Acetivibrio cellulolyticus TaxID=35830 RepID=UPI0001E2F5D9|nr:hypothetical protein [Acetivibrio cellulolyticus]
MNLGKAKGAIMTGIIASAIVGLIELSYLILPIVFRGSFENIRLLIDVSIWGGLAFGLYKKSRVCAIGLFLYYEVLTFLKVIVLKNTANFNFIFWAFITYGLVRGIMGTYYYHKFKTNEDETDINMTL